MIKPKYVYHGTGVKIKENLIPKKAKNLDDNLDNSLKGVYASSWKKEAIIMGLFGCKGVKGASTHITGKNKIDAVIYDGYPRQTYFYLCQISSKTFENRSKGGLQWVSLEKVKPKKIEKLKVKDYIHLIRKATEREKKDWLKNYRYKIN